MLNKWVSLKEHHQNKHFKIHFMPLEERVLIQCVERALTAKTSKRPIQFMKKANH